MGIGRKIGMWLFKTKFVQKAYAKRLLSHPGNNKQYSVQNVKEDFIGIEGKKIIFLGSSVTNGDGSLNESFVDYLAKKDGVAVLAKEAVGGTTLVTKDEKDYIPRMEKLNIEDNPDLFICQLSTNDTRFGYPLGAPTKDENLDMNTIAGAIQYIIRYAKKNYNCRVAFYTGTKYNSDIYEAMVKLLYEIKEVEDIDIIDLWNDKEMLAVNKEDYKLYMMDPVHPTKAGYLLWWLPCFERYIKNI